MTLKLGLFRFATLAARMKPVLPLVLLLLSTLLTACPSAQTPPVTPPTPSTNLTGDWSGTLTHSDGQNIAIPLTVTFTQTDNDLSGTASLGNAPFQISGAVTGSLEENSAIFAFSAVVAEDSVEGQMMRTYTFNGALSGDSLAGDVVATTEGADLSIPGTFTLGRQ